MFSIVLLVCLGFGVNFWLYLIVCCLGLYLRERFDLDFACCVGLGGFILRVYSVVVVLALRISVWQLFAVLVFPVLICDYDFGLLFKKLVA